MGYFDTEITVSLRNCAHSFDFRYLPTRMKMPYARAFHEVISMYFNISIYISIHSSNTY